VVEGVGMSLELGPSSRPEECRAVPAVVQPVLLLSCSRASSPSKRTGTSMAFSSQERVPSGLSSGNYPQPVLLPQLEHV
jgi:hypothetical protein